MLFETLLRDKILEDLKTSSGVNIEVSSDFSFNTETDDPILILTTTAGNPISLQGITATTAPIMITFLVNHILREEWLETLKEYLTTLRGAPITLGTMTCLFSFNDPSIANTPFTRNGEKWATFTITGECVYSDNISIGTDFSITLDGVQLENIIRWALASNNSAETVTKEGSFAEFLLPNTNSFGVTINMLLKRDSDTYSMLMQKAFEASADNVLVEAEIEFNSTTTNMTVLMQSNSMSAESIGFAFAQVAIIRYGDNNVGD